MTNAFKYAPGDEVILLEFDPDAGQSWGIIEYVYSHTCSLFIVHSTHADYKYGDRYQAPHSRLSPYFGLENDPLHREICAGFNQMEMERDIARVFDQYPINYSREVRQGAIKFLLDGLATTARLILLISIFALMVGLWLTPAAQQLFHHARCDGYPNNECPPGWF